LLFYSFTLLSTPRSGGNFLGKQTRLKGKPRTSGPLLAMADPDLEPLWKDIAEI